ncbi:MAG: ATP-binding cassette domain-containing protein [Rhodospirillales bacterium]
MPPPSCADDPAPVLAVHDLGFGYREGFRLHGISFALRRGSFTALLGVNGAGKSTLFALLTRLFDAASGEVRIAGFDLRRRSSAALAALGVVFQQPTLDLDLTVEQNLHYAAALHGLAGAGAQQRIGDEMDRLGLTAQRRQKVRTLSGGLRRRVELARALLHRPALLLMDEPTVGLDPPSRRLMVEHVHQLAREHGISVLWATHLIDEVRTDDQVVVLHGGRIIAAGGVGDINAAAGCAALADSFAALVAPPAAAGAAG